MSANQTPRAGDVVSSLRSWAKRWPLAGMFALGLVAGAIGSYAVAQRSELKRLAELAFRMKGGVVDESAEVGEKPVPVATHRSNRRRKAVEKVKR